MAKYAGTLNTGNVIGASTVTLVKDQYVTIGKYTVKADELVAMGYGDYAAQNTANGRIYCDFKDNSTTPVAIQGMFRIMEVTSQGIPVGEKPVVIDVDCAALAQGSSNRTERIAFPETHEYLSKDKEFLFQIKNTASSAQTLVLANSTCMLDITRQLV